MSELDDPLVARVAAELRRPVMFAPDFDARIMAVVRAEPRPGSLAQVWAALGRPRPVMISPLGGLAMAAGISALVLGAAIAAGNRPQAPTAAAPAALASQDGTAGPAPVQFVLVMPGARTVALVGDFNDWDMRAVPLEASGDGVWTVMVPLAPGRYRYTFVVDGSRWITDPGAPGGADDDFGRPNSVITVGEHGL